MPSSLTTGPRPSLKSSCIRSSTISSARQTADVPASRPALCAKPLRFWQVRWRLDEDVIAYARNSDGMFPLLTNDRSLSTAEVFEAYKRQPRIGKRLAKSKSVYEIAPVLLKTEGRIEALFFVYVLALLVQALIERELRQSMQRKGIASLPLYPEERISHRPTEQVFRLFSLVQRHHFDHGSVHVRTFAPAFTDLQWQMLELLWSARRPIGNVQI